MSRTSRAKSSLFIILAVLANVIAAGIINREYDFSAVEYIGVVLGTAAIPFGISLAVSLIAIIPKKNRQQFVNYFSKTFLGFSVGFGLIASLGSLL